MTYPSRPLTSLALWGCSLALLVQGCTGTNSTPDQEAGSEMSSSAETSTDATAAEGGEGTLVFRANGEDFVRQGFTTRDGWEISFDHVYVTLADVTAYQTDPPFDAEKGTDMAVVETVSLDQPVTVDLAEGDATAEPIQVGEVMAPAGRYNALSWEMVPASEGPAAGYPLVLQGTATKAGETVDFTLKMTEDLAFTCGDFVGDTRKGILSADDTADLEATFHFDHLFGDGEAPADDDINTGALGFDPLAALATDGQLDVDSTALKDQLSPEDYQTLRGILPSLGHVGEGHCEEVKLTS